MSVFREFEMKWKGEVYEIKPNLALLRRIKGRGINNVQLAQACFNGGVDMEDLVIVHCAFLASAGVEISEEESYEFLSTGAPEVIEFQLAYVQTVIQRPRRGPRSRRPRLRRDIHDGAGLGTGPVRNLANVHV